MRITIPRLAVFIVLIVFVVLFIINYFGLDIASTVNEHFQEVSQPLVGLSVSLIIFPIITVPLVGDIVSRVKNLGIKVNRNLVKDYVDGCFTIFAIAVMELLMILIKPFYDIIIYLIISFLFSLVVILIALMLSLWKIVKLLYEVIATQ